MLSERSEVSLIVTNGTVITMDGARRVLSCGAVAIDGPFIVAVDDRDVIEARYSARDTIDAQGAVVMPGLVNTHCHAPMVMYRGLADDMSLLEWLSDYILPAEGQTLSPELVRVGSRLAVLEMIQSGTTLFTDMYYFEEETAAVASQAGIRGVLGQAILNFPVADASGPKEGLARAERFIQAFSGDPLILPTVAPHAMYTLDGPFLKASREMACRHGVPLIIHLAETAQEVKDSMDRHGRTPAAYLESLGFWETPAIAAHCVHMSEADIGILARNGVGVAHNPASNMKLVSGAAPLTRMLRAGLSVGMGTDGAASSNDLDMFQAMRLTSLLHKLMEGDPTAASASTVLEMATLGGAKALGLDDRIGSLEAGKWADLIVVSMDSPRQTPVYNPVSHLVYAGHGSDVLTSIVHGKVLMRDRRMLTLDPEQVMRDAREMARHVQASVGK